MLPSTILGSDDRWPDQDKVEIVFSVVLRGKKKKKKNVLKSFLFLELCSKHAVFNQRSIHYVPFLSFFYIRKLVEMYKWHRAAWGSQTAGVPHKTGA